MSSDDDYRELLVERELRIGEGFDKTLITLSGGSLGLTLIFVTDFVGPGNVLGKGWILSAWIFWGLSLASVLVAHYFGQIAYRKALHQIDDILRKEIERENADVPTAEKNSAEKFGGTFSTIVDTLNFVGGISFLVGLVAIIVFTFMNLEDSNERTETPAEATPTTLTDTTSKADTRTEERFPDKGDSRSRSTTTSSTEKELSNNIASRILQNFQWPMKFSSRNLTRY